MKNKLTYLILFMLSVAFFSNFSIIIAKENNSKIGKFDFSKVQRAVKGNTIDTNNGNKVNLPKTPSMISVIIRMVLWLSVILFVIIALVYFFRKVVYQNKVLGGNGELDVLETTSIMPGKSLSLIRVADRVLLLGIHQDGIRALTEFTGEDALNIVKNSNAGNNTKTVAQFSDTLNSFMGKFKNK